ncbi:MAG TPA: methyltransferase domain-containing protein [Acidimicrobiales bacterium]|jgi:SAM-dependent methyltransferase|nr:methyltransferase domain-containing protein [Acidimicrobiales bacterium]
MLTVDYDRLGIQAGEHVLDIGAGAGRHSFEVLRRGAHVAAVDLDDASLKDVSALVAGLYENGDVDPSVAGAAAIQGSALDLPFPDASFDRAIASEVMEHISDDNGALREIARVVRPGGVIAVTVPRWFPELVNWALSDEYHAPAAAGGHIRIYREGVLRGRMEAAGFDVFDRHHAHGLHAPYWWLKCAVGVNNAEHPLVKRYHDLLVREMVEQPLSLKIAERILQPAIGKSLVLYGRRRREDGGAA